MSIKESDSLSKKIIEYNHLCSSSDCDKNLLEKIRQDILFEIRLIIYYLPQKHLNLNEEDASDFLLFMEPKLNGIIKNYTYITSNFTAYIYPILARKIMTFKKEKNTRERRETVISGYHSYYEEILRRQENYRTSFAAQPDAEQNISLKRLKYICTNHSTTEKRFFIYLMSLANILDEQMIRTVCNTFNFDFKETYEMIRRVIKRTPQSCKNRIMTERRNLCWIKYLFHENEIQTKNFYSDEYDLYKYREKAEQYRTNLYNHNKYIHERKNTVSKTIVAEVLGITAASAALSFFYIKNILSFCQTGEASKGNNMGINPALFEDITANSWEDSPENTNPALFSPFKVFGII